MARIRLALLSALLFTGCFNAPTCGTIRATCGDGNGGEVSLDCTHYGAHTEYGHVVLDEPFLDDNAALREQSAEVQDACLEACGHAIAER